MCESCISGGLVVWKFFFLKSASRTKGLHDAVHTYTYMVFPPPWFLFCNAGHRENIKTYCYFGFTLEQDSKFQPSMCWYSLSPSCSSVLWYKLNEKFWDFVFFPYWPVRRGFQHGYRKYDNFAKLAWYDITWNSSIGKLVNYPFFSYRVCQKIPQQKRLWGHVWER